MPPSPPSHAVAEHYARPDLLGLIDRGLAAAGLDPEHPRPEEMAAFDQFHTRGLDATLELAELAGLRPGDRVLDLGGGIGGAARVLASRFGAAVTVLDLTPGYCAVGEALTRRLGLAERVRFVEGDATDPALEPASFDLVWLQHAGMNIAAKERLARAGYRMLRQGGRLALHEILAGPVQPIHFPVPWASTPALSHLVSPAEFRATLSEAGLAELAWRDVTGATVAWAVERFAAQAGGPPPLGLHLLLGEGFRPAFQNVARNFTEDRLRVVAAVFQRPN